MDAYTIYWSLTFSTILAGAGSVNPTGGLVTRLMSQRDHLIQDGLSFFNSSMSSQNYRASMSLAGIRNVTNGHQVRCLIHVENWTRWLLGSPISYFKHGTFQSGFHEREVFPSHQEIVIAGNQKEHSFTGTSGILAWELDEQDVHLLVMWSVPYNLGIYNSYLGIGVVQLTTRFTTDLLPYWYREMVNQDKGRVFQRGRPGTNILFRHEKFFVVANMEDGYQPVLNVSVMPWSTKDLAASIWHKLYLDSLKTEMKSEAFSSCCGQSWNTILNLVTVCLMYSLSW